MNISPRKSQFRFEIGSLIVLDLALGAVFYNKPAALALYYAPSVLCFAFFGIAAWLKER
jgi:hypothetical protein